MAVKERIVRLLPFLPTDRGSIEAWLNDYAEHGWRFSERILWQGIVFRARQPGEEGRMLYRLKSIRSDSVLERCLCADGWRRHPEKIAGYEVWCKRTTDPDEQALDTLLPDGSEHRWHRKILLADLLFGISMLLDGAGRAGRTRGISTLSPRCARAITSIVLGLSLIVHWFLCRKNMEDSPGFIARFLSGLLTLLIVLGIISDVILIFVP